MPRFDWLKKHHDNLKRGDVANLKADLDYCRARAKIAGNKALTKAWLDRARDIEKAIAALEAKDS